MKNLNILFIIFFIHPIYPQNNSLQITPEGISAERYTTVNPELDFISFFEDTSYGYDLTEHLVCRIIYDFNFDSIEDIALTDIRFWGAHIGPWAIYLGLENDKYEFLDEIWFHNDAVKFDSVSKGKSKIIVFEKAGGGVADIVEYLLTSDGIKEMKRITLYPKNEEMNETYIKANNEFNFQTLEDSCIVVSEYLKSKKLEWKQGY